MLRRHLLTLPFTAAVSQLLAQNDPCRPCPNRVPADAWKELDDGNLRFTGWKPANRQDQCRLGCTAEPPAGPGQRPFAVVLTCSDSRIVPEIAFDQRIGDLFVVRVAGNVATEEAVGSIEYVIENMRTPKVVVVLGHDDCGAVGAALKGEPAADLVPSILNRIYPAIRDLGPKDLDKAIRANTKLAANTLAKYSTAIRRVPVIGAHYSLKTGRITKV